LTNIAVAVQSSDVDIAGEFERKVAIGGASRRGAILETARKFGLSSKQVYAAIERVKKIGE